MTKPWAKSFTYREARNGLMQRFSQMKQHDRIAVSELFPNIEAIDGFFFAINSAPAKVSPTEWLGDLLPMFQVLEDKSAEIVSLLISYQLHSKARLERQKYALPEERDPINAIKAGSALNSFSHGFEVGYQRIASIWSSSVPQELRKELNAQVFALRFFSSTHHANEYIKENNSEMRPDQLAEQVLKNLPKAADLHVRLGLAIEAGRSQVH